MTVGELIEKLSEYDEDMPVLMDTRDNNPIQVDGTVDNGDVIVIY